MRTTTLKVEMCRRGLSQTDMAHALGVSRTLISEVTNSAKRPSQSFMEKAAAFLDLPVDELFPPSERFWESNNHARQ